MGSYGAVLPFHLFLSLCTEAIVSPHCRFPSRQVLPSPSQPKRPSPMPEDGNRRLGALRRKLRPLRASDRRGRAGEGPALRPDAAALVSETTAPLAPPRLRPRTHNALDHNAELRRGGNERYNVNSHEGPSSCRPGLAIEL